MTPISPDPEDIDLQSCHTNTVVAKRPWELDRARISSKLKSHSMQTETLTDAIEVRAGLVLGRYELLTPIAAGGMAQVWAARMKGARQFQKIVAVKTMLPKLSEDAQFEQMFLDEASLASQIRHPNAVEIMDLGEAQGVLYLVMEWIDGVPLNHLMKAAKPRGGIPLPIAARIAMQACAGLHAAHELHDEKGRSVGLVHRDVSPQNLLVTYDGVTKVVDFGVAKATAIGTAAVTQAGQVKGKVSYMAPEQINGEGLDRRADVFALGIVLYALSTGKHPFRRESEAATMYNICSKDPAVSPTSVIEGYPKELEAILLKSLEKNRDKRYASCDEMLRALDSLPSQLRVGSDADVGQFVRELMAERRAEQRRRIDEAIAKADASPTENWPGHETTNGGRISVTTPDLSGVTGALNQQAKRNRLIGAAGLAALAISGGILTVTFINPTQDQVAKPEIKELPEPVEDTPSAELPTTEAPDNNDQAGVALDDLPEEAQPPRQPTPSATQEGTDTPAEDKTEDPATDEGPTQAPASPSPKPTAKPKDSWKYDAGF